MLLMCESVGLFLAEEFAEHGGVEFAGDVGVGEEVVGEFGFFLLEAVDAFFDGVEAEEFVDEDGFVLADAVGAVGGLGFGGGVPPGVVVDYGVCGGEVEAGAAGFEGDEEDGEAAGLELLDEFSAVFGAAGELEVGGVVADELVLDEAEHGGELGEDEDAAAFLDEGGEELGEEVEFGGFGDSIGEVVREEAGIAADLAELEEGVEEDDL